MELCYDGFDSAYSDEGFGVQEHGRHPSRHSRPPQVAMASKQFGSEIRELMGALNLLVTELVGVVRIHHQEMIDPRDSTQVYYMRKHKHFTPTAGGHIRVEFRVRMASAVIKSMRQLDLVETLNAFKHLSKFFKRMQMKYYTESNDQTQCWGFIDLMHSDMFHTANYNPDEHIKRGTTPVSNAMKSMVKAFANNNRELHDAVSAGNELAWDEALWTFITKLSTEDTDRIVFALEKILLRHKHMHALLCLHGPSLTVYVQAANDVNSPNSKPMLVSISSDYATIRDLLAACGYRMHHMWARNTPLGVVFFTVNGNDHRTHRIIYDHTMNIDDLLCRHVHDQKHVWIALADFDFRSIQPRDPKWW